MNVSFIRECLTRCIFLLDSNTPTNAVADVYVVQRTSTDVFHKQHKPSSSMMLYCTSISSDSVTILHSRFDAEKKNSKFSE